MKCRTEFLVEKGRGGVELLRATKLWRSIYLALQHADPTAQAPSDPFGHPDPEGLASELTTAVLAQLQTAHDHGPGRPVPSGVIAETVQRTLRENGLPVAARVHESVGMERQRRRARWGQLALATVPSPASAVAAADRATEASDPRR